MVSISVYDKVFQILMEEQMHYQELPSSGLLRKGFGISYEYGDEYIFVIGGEDLDSFEYTSKCLKFNANSLKWEGMPDLNHPRFFPGTF
jgi:hypothetical protein